MKSFIRYSLILAVLGGLLFWGGRWGQQWLAERNKPRYRLARLETGDLRISVNATGELNPVLKVKVGSFVKIGRAHV